MISYIDKNHTEAGFSNYQKEKPNTVNIFTSTEAVFHAAAEPHTGTVRGPNISGSKMSVDGQDGIGSDSIGGYVSHMSFTTPKICGWCGTGEQNNEPQTKATLSKLCNVVPRARTEMEHEWNRSGSMIWDKVVGLSGIFTVIMLGELATFSGLSQGVDQ